MKQRLEEVLGAFTYGGRRKAQALLNPEDRDRRWSNDRFLSTPHGVINESGTDRYSIAYFHSPNPASTIECLPSCVSTENPARYPPAAYRDLVLEFYRKNYFHQKGYKSEAVEQPNA
ncbi:MAG: 2OG-Fe(II) oxygenase family protein [Rhodopila sp.]